MANNKKNGSTKAKADLTKASTYQASAKRQSQNNQGNKGGKKKAIGALVGQTMKAMKGKADPGTVNRMLAELLDE